jgi:two-component system response regulator YesN
MNKRIFLVDDEIVIRENIRNCINWAREGFIYCGDASDGEMALPMIEELKPDILITDIKMPFMNGLELSAIVRKQLPQTKIILISGHDEFEYVRQALRIGVEDYCLKPIGAADLIRLLREVADKIDREAEFKRKIEHLTKSLSDRRQQSREQLISQLCGGLIPSAEAIETAANLQIPLIARFYAVILTDIRMHGASEKDLPPVFISHAEHEPVSIHSVENELASFMGKHAEYLTARRSRTENIWVLKSDCRERLEALSSLLGDAAQSIEARYGCSIAYGIGSIQHRLHGVHTSFIEAEEDKHWRKITRQHRGTLLDITAGSGQQEVFLNRDEFLEFLTLGSRDNAEASIRKLASGLARIEWSSSLYGYYALTDLTFAVLNKARQLYRLAEPIEASVEPLRQMIQSIQSWEDACRYLLRLAELFWKWRSEAAGPYGELIAQVKAFVLQHYSQVDLSLQDAANHVNVSPSHLSKIFSQETGQTFIDFLMKTRIRKAMELLLSTNAKSYEVAYQVGYHDPSYFSNLFKRVTGMTIREFRKNGWQHAELLKGEDPVAAST